jgi:glycosyltransferase involved in cell wall biosynthesis
MKILFFSGRDWGLESQRPHHIASGLSKIWPLVFIDPLGLRKFQVQDILRVRKRLKNIFLNNKKTDERQLKIFSPVLYFPFPNNEIATKLNAFILGNALKKYVVNEDICFWISSPSNVTNILIELLRPKLIIYDCLDEYHEFFKNSKEILQLEERIVKKANIVFSTSLNLFNRMKLINKNVYLLPNGVEYEKYISQDALTIPLDIKHIKNPIIGYVGGVSEWFDFELFYEAATKLSYCNFVLVGPIDYGRLEQEPFYKLLRQCSNVYFLGLKPYQQMPNYINNFDILTIPFKINNLTISVDPLKIYEYLAVGKPVITTPLPEVFKFESIINISKGKSHFIELIEKLINNTEDHEMKIKRRLAVQNDSWDNRILTIKEKIESYIKEN